LGTKKGRAAARPLRPRARHHARGWSLDQIPQPRKGLGQPINRQLGNSEAWSLIRKCRLRAWLEDPLQADGR
jgi:hypothetical protein